MKIALKLFLEFIGNSNVVVRTEIAIYFVFFLDLALPAYAQNALPVSVKYLFCVTLKMIILDLGNLKTLFYLVSRLRDSGIQKTNDIREGDDTDGYV